MMGENIVAGRTASGFDFSVDKRAMDDMELLEDLVALDEGNLQKIPSICNKFLGEIQKKRLYDHLRTEDGRVPVTSVMQHLKEIMDACGAAGKNS